MLETSFKRPYTLYLEYPNDYVHNAAFRKMSGQGIGEKLTFMKKFKPETNETIYNVLTTICRNIGISPDGIEDDVIRISSETVSVVVVNEKKYIEKMKKVEKPKPYIQYRNQNIILIVAFVTLVAVQSAVPPFQPENTVPGCVLSFAGFPLEGGEDGNTDGLRYLACVLNISKSSIGVWSAIQSIKKLSEKIQYHKIDKQFTLYQNYKETATARRFSF
jgi:hypothetical protein